MDLNSNILSKLPVSSFPVGQLLFWEGFGNKWNGQADSQPIIYSEKLLLLVSRLQSPRVCFSLRIIHGFSQWQIVGLQKCAFHNFSPEESSVTQGSGNVTIHTRNTTVLHFGHWQCNMGWKKSSGCSDSRKMMGGFFVYTWTALSCVSVRGMPAGLFQEPEF